MSTAGAAVGRADLHRLRRRAEPLDQSIGHVPDRHGDAAGHAALAGAAERRGLQRPDGLVEVGVGHDDQMVLGPAGRLHALAVPRAGFVDRCRATAVEPTNETARTRGCASRASDALAVAVDDVEHTLGQPRLDEQLAQPHGRQRHLLGGLEDERVAAGDRDREHPERAPSPGS